MKKKVSIALIFVLMLSCLTACGGGGESTASGESSVAAEETKQTEKTSAKKMQEGDKVFEQKSSPDIPEGYEQVEWSDQLPREMTYKYVKIMNPQTEMVGVATYDGEIIIDPEYSGISLATSDDTDDYFLVDYEGKLGVINGSGKVIIEPAITGHTRSNSGRLMYFETYEGGVTCITLNMTTGDEFGRFDIPTASAQTTIESTVWGPYYWICPVAEDETGDLVSLGIRDYEGNVLSDLPFAFSGPGDFEINLEVNWQVVGDGYTSQQIKETDDTIKYYIFNKDGQVVAGPYDSVETCSNAFVCTNNGVKEIYAPSLQQASINADFLGEQNLKAVFDSGVALYDTDANPSLHEIYLRDLETGESTVIAEDAFNREKIFLETERFIYLSNDTYKFVDLKGNPIGDDRYYDLCEADPVDEMEQFDGVFLKQENGDWVYVDGDGNLSKEDGLFHGDEDAPTTYNDLPIVGFWEYEGTPCVVVEEEDKQVGYVL